LFSFSFILFPNTFQLNLYRKHRLNGKSVLGSSFERGVVVVVVVW
jgi:hypothetical protein